MVFDVKGQPVVVEIEKCDIPTLMKLHRNDDSASMGSGSSSCGSHYAIMDQASSSNCKVDAAALVGKVCIELLPIARESINCFTEYKRVRNTFLCPPYSTQCW